MRPSENHLFTRWPSGTVFERCVCLRAAGSGVPDVPFYAVRRRLVIDTGGRNHTESTRREGRTIGRGTGVRFPPMVHLDSKAALARCESNAIWAEFVVVGKCTASLLHIRVAPCGTLPGGCRRGPPGTARLGFYDALIRIPRRTHRRARTGRGGRTRRHPARGAVPCELPRGVSQNGMGRGSGSGRRTRPVPGGSRSGAAHVRCAPAQGPLSLGRAT